MLSVCMHARSELLSPLVDRHINNVLLHTARQQQGTASAHSCNKTYSCSSYPRNYMITTTTTILWPFVQNYLGELIPEYQKEHPLTHTHPGHILPPLTPSIHYYSQHPNPYVYWLVGAYDKH